MAINPAIALGVKGIEVQDPLASYGRVAAIQNAQNQNALAQFQLEAARREEAAQNALSAAYQAAYDPNKGTYDINKLRQSLISAGSGAKMPDVEKKLGELRTQQLTQQKTEGEVLDAALKRSRGFLETLDPNAPGAAEAYLAWHEANHRDPIIGKALEARGITAEQSRGRIMQLLNTPGGLARLINESKLGTEKFMELNKPQLSTKDTGSQLIDRTFSPLTGEIRTISTEKKTMSPYESARIGQEDQRLAQEATGVVYQEDANGNIVALPSKLKKGEVPTARVAVAPGGGFQPLAAKPSEAVGKEQMSINQQKAIVRGALDAVTATPDAFGWTTGNLPEAIRARTATPAENEARSYLFNVVSGVIKERAGTAQSAAEAETLRRFLPVETDNADIIKDKMTAFDKYLTAKEAGTTKKRPAAEAPKYPGAPSIGTVQQGYRYKGGDPAQQSSWEKQ